MIEDFWISADNFKYTDSQVAWLLRWLPELRRMGVDWPPQTTEETGYTGRQKHIYLDGSAMTKARAVRGHLDNMLCLEREDGIKVKLFYCAGDDLETIGRYFNLPGKVVAKNIENCLKRIEMRIYRSNAVYRLSSTKSGGTLTSHA